MRGERHDDATWERSAGRGVWRRLTLRRADGEVYLNRWGLSHRRIGGVFLHRMDAPDPGLDLHDHPWWFASFVLAGGYAEERTETRWAPTLARLAEHGTARGETVVRHRWSLRTMRLDECHRITKLTSRRCWTLVILGPVRRKWGFYLAAGYMVEAEYDATVGAERRDLWSVQNAPARPWRVGETRA